MNSASKPFRFARRFFFLLVLFALLAPVAGRAGMEVQACFSPAGRCSSHILLEIGRAKQEVLAAVYALTSDDLAWALVEAKKRGVRVQVILDRAFDKEYKNSKGAFLVRQQVPVRRISGVGSEDRGLMHQKFAVIDRATVLTGSYNWTVSADKFNHENLLVFRDAGPLAGEYRRQFLQLWDKQN